MEELKERLIGEITEHLDSDKVSTEYLDVLGRLLATILPYVYAGKAEKQNKAKNKSMAGKFFVRLTEWFLRRWRTFYKI